MTNLADIEGVGPAYAAKLEAAGVKNEEALLKMGATPKGRKEVAEKSGISEKLILEWVNRVDLARVKGIGSEYADLLEASGVDTVVELATRKPENLVAKMTEVNTAKKLVRKMPTLSQVEDWVKQAKDLPRAVSY
jgi:predicted flap endonuclease-1-like 5' DNA nuclease